MKGESAHSLHVSSVSLISKNMYNRSLSRTRNPLKKRFLISVELAWFNKSQLKNKSIEAMTKEIFIDKIGHKTNTEDSAVKGRTLFFPWPVTVLEDDRITRYALGPAPVSCFELHNSQCSQRNQS